MCVCVCVCHTQVEALTEQLHNAQFLCAEAQAKLTAAEASVIRITKEKDEVGEHGLRTHRPRMPLYYQV